MRYRIYFIDGTYGDFSYSGNLEQDALSTLKFISLYDEAQKRVVNVRNDSIIRYWKLKYETNNK